MTIRHAAHLTLASLLLVPAALAGGGERLSTEGARMTLSVQDSGGGIPDAPIASRYGAEGSEWILFGAGVAYDFDKATDVNLHIGYSMFLVEDVEWVLELGGWYHSQDGGDALSLNPVMEFRWHFYNRGDTSLFVNAGIGLLGATDNVPHDGSGFDFTPRAGVGITHRIGADGTRLIGGLRWHHISNARFNGEDRNPGRDAPMVYMQIAVPF